MSVELAKTARRLDLCVERSSCADDLVDAYEILCRWPLIWLLYSSRADADAGC